MTVPEKINSLTSLKTITASKINSAINKEVAFCCPDCGERKFTIVPPDGVIACPDCGYKPDLLPKLKAVTLTQESRLKLADELFKPGGEVNEYCIDVFERYGDLIDQIYKNKLSEKILHKSFPKEFRSLQETADWLLSGKSKAPSDCKVYSEDGLLRKQSGGNIKVLPLSKVSTNLEKGLDESPMEAAEALSFSKGYSEPFFEKEYERVELLACVSDPLDKRIVDLISQGCNKTDVAKMLCLTTQKLQTRLKYIGNELLHGPKQKSNITKACKRCGQIKSIDDFGRDSRRKDGLQGVCRTCDAKRKKKFINFTGRSLKIA